jgi:hypothetical protein
MVFTISCALSLPKKKMAACFEQISLWKKLHWIKEYHFLLSTFMKQSYPFKPESVNKKICSNQMSFFPFIHYFNLTFPVSFRSSQMASKTVGFAQKGSKQQKILPGKRIFLQPEIPLFCLFIGSPSGSWSNKKSKLEDFCSLLWQNLAQNCHDLYFFKHSHLWMLIELSELNSDFRYCSERITSNDSTKIERGGVFEMEEKRKIHEFYFITLISDYAKLSIMTNHLLLNFIHSFRFCYYALFNYPKRNPFSGLKIKT